MNLTRIFHSPLISTGLQPGEPATEMGSAASAALARCGKPLKRLLFSSRLSTGLKPGANEIRPAQCEIATLNAQHSTFNLEHPMAQPWRWFVLEVGGSLLDVRGFHFPYA